MAIPPPSRTNDSIIRIFNFELRIKNFELGMQYSVVHLKYSFAQEWEQDLLEQALCDVGFEVFDGENA